MTKINDILHKISLLPRYNWDYTLSDFCGALPAAFVKPADLENTFEEIFGRRPVLTTSGRVSLYLILKSLDLPEGSAVGVPLFVCPIVFETIKKAGLVPTFLDVNFDDYTISSEDLAEKMGSLSAVVAVHMFGHPAKMVLLCAEKRQLLRTVLKPCAALIKVIALTCGPLLPFSRFVQGSMYRREKTVQFS